jgi:DNA-binding response OmpR family regulator
MKARILVVDDEETMRRSLADILRLEGYQVHSLSNGMDAIHSLETDIYDLMLLDLKMPGIDGLEVLRAAGRLAPEMMVILLTAHGSLESAIEALRHEASDYLLKPSSPDKIIHSVETALEKRQANQHKQKLMDQLETSLHELKKVQRREPPTTPIGRVLTLKGGISCDLARRELWHGSQKVLLTPTEGKLLRVMLDHRGKVMTHRELVLLVQGYEVNDWEAPEVLRPLVSRLRQKLAQFDGSDWIENVRGTGYIFDWPE